ncbi:unnamed protein product [Ixodes persulcatus]
MLSASEESLFRSIEKRAKDAPCHVYRYHPVDLAILIAFVVSVLLVFVGFYYYEMRYPLGGLFWRGVQDEGNEGNSTETANTTAATEASNNTNTSSVVSAVYDTAFLQSLDRYPLLERSTKTSVCSDRSCRSLARYLKESLKPSADPCNNFYEFVCSHWSLRDKLRPGEAVVTEDSIRTKDIEDFLVTKLKENGLKRPSESAGESMQDESLRWTKNAFAECKLGVKTGRKAFRSILEHQGLRGFPFQKDPIKMGEMAARVVRVSGLSPLVRVSLDEDKKDGKRVIRLSPSEDLIFRDFWTVSGSHQKWYNAAVAKATSGKALPNVFNVEKKLTELSATCNDAGGPLLLRVSEMESFHKWNWKEFLRTLFDGVVNVTRSTYVRIESETFAKGLTSLLRSFRSRDIANFLGFRVYLKHAPVLDKLRQLSVLGTTLHPGWNESLTKDISCLRLLMEIEPFILMHLYWDTFKATLEPGIVENIVQNAKNTILNYVESVTWLQPSFKSAYEDRLQNTTCRYLVPRWLTEEEKRLRYSRTVADHVHYSGMNTYGPVIEAVEKNRLRGIDESGFDVSWESRLLETAPVWARDDVLEFPMAMFSRQFEGDAFWLYHLPRAGVKVVVALLAALVETARASDQSVYSDLLGTKTCLEGHYRTMRETQVPERLTSSVALENEVLENMALPLALLLYRSYVNPKSEISLDALKGYSSDQLFFINYAMGRCEAQDSRFAWQKLRYGRTPPAAYRVNGPLRNSENFADSFMCPIDSYMNPASKCSLWKN